MRLPEFEVREVEEGTRVLLTARGEVDMATVGALRAAIERAVCAGRDVWLDLSDVDFMDSTGLTALVAGHQALDGRHRFTVICPVEGAVRRALDVSGLDQVLAVYPSRDAAEAA
jgi:anti-anti-sigma factor